MFKIVFKYLSSGFQEISQRTEKSFTKNGSFTYTHTHTQKGCFLQGNKERCEQPLLKQSQYLKESLNQIKTKVN